jgi:hypothetical protein
MTDSRSDRRIDRSSASGRTAPAGVAAVEANGLAQDDRAAPDSLDEPGEIRKCGRRPGPEAGAPSLIRNAIKHLNRVTSARVRTGLRLGFARIGSLRLDEAIFS